MNRSTPPDAIILLVDSDPLMRSVLHDALHDAGYLVVVAGNLGLAVDRLREIHPDLLVTRPYINSMTGPMAAEYLRSKRPGLPVLIVSGYLDDDRVRDQNAIQDFHTFPKPFNRTDLLAAVEGVLNSLRKS